MASVAPRIGSAGGQRSAVEALEIVVEHHLGELPVTQGVHHPVVLAGEIAPRLVGGEKDTVAADAPAVDLGGEPVRSESDSPGQVGVNLLSRADPVEEPASDQLDVAAHAAAEVHQVDLVRIPVTVD